MNPSVFEIRKHTEPEVGFFALGYVHAQKFFSFIAGKSHDIIVSTCHKTVLFIIHYLVMERIKPHNGIYAAQKSVFPTLYLRKDMVRNATDGLGRYTVVELVFTSFLMIVHSPSYALFNRFIIVVLILHPCRIKESDLQLFNDQRFELLRNNNVSVKLIIFYLLHFSLRSPRQLE